MLFKYKISLKNGTTFIGEPRSYINKNFEPAIGLWMVEENRFWQGLPIYIDKIECLGI